MADANDEFEAMYESNAPLIYRFMFWRTKDKMLSEDLTSSVFEKAWKSRDSFKGGSPTAWLHRIAHNTLIDRWRKRQEILVEDPAALEVPSDQAEPVEVLDRTLLVERLRQAVSTLPRDMQAVIELRFMKGYSAKQTGQKLGLSEANVRVMQYRALRKLRDYLQ